MKVPPPAWRLSFTFDGSAQRRGIVNAEDARPF
jgi:hypothetical protein